MPLSVPPPPGLSHAQPRRAAVRIVVALLGAALSASAARATPAAAAATATPASPADLEFFEKKIRPLLIERCSECHAPEHKIKAGLRLDSAHGWLTGGDSGPAVIPGNVDASPLVKAIRYTGLDFEPMPPKSALPKEEVALLEDWVRRGAPAPAPTATEAGAKKASGMSVADGRNFWSFRPRTTPAVPDLAGAPAALRAWPRTDLDRFLAAAWTEKKLPPAPDAPAAALLRRLSYDLTGLPPTPDETAAFVRDHTRDPAATLRATVDRLLASPHFGERWGRRWLDIARFAESSGGGRTLVFKDAWRYRDYVIDAFNRDLPFDTFIREQLAGDLLPAPTPEDRRRQVTATAFLSLGPTNYEEQNKDQLRMDVVDEQLDTLGKAFLGMTLGCARCHDHKFDPVPMRDYYALAGILRSTHTLHNYTDNVARWVDAELPVPAADAARFAAHTAEVTALEKKIAALKLAAGSAVATPGQTVTLASLPGLVSDDQQGKIVGDWKVSTTVKSYLGAGYLTDNNEGKGQKTVTFTPAIPRTGRYEVRLAYTPQPNRASNVPVTLLHADGEQVVVVNQRERPPLDGHFVSLGTYRFEQEGQGYILVSTEGTDGFVIVDALQLIPAAGTAEPVAPPVVLAGTADGPKKAAKKAAAVAALPADPAARQAVVELRRLEADLKKLVAAGPKRELAMSVREAAGEIGDTEIRIRGIARQLGAKVPRGFLSVAAFADTPAFPAAESGRRELAEWIADPRHPLTARVTVNRVWAWLMGAGLVRTLENFGTTGEPPSHPALLDHLAGRFVADGWSMKQLVRSIVLSRAYALSAAPTPDAARLDPDNRLYSHARRRRLEAEELRDTILHAAGRLDLAFGGPNFGAKADAPAPSSEYTFVYADTRRSVYTPAFRNRRLDLFEAFDFADVNAPIGQRHVTTVAPQALFLMNHPWIIEQAQHAAARLQRDFTDARDAVRLDHLYRTVLSRAPTDRERALALDFLASGEPDAWTQLYQAVFASIDFRYLE